MFGLFLIILAQASYSIGGVLLKKYLSNYNPLLVSCLLAIFSAIIFLPILLIGFRSTLTNLTFKNLLPFIITAIVWLVIGEVLYIYGFQKTSSLTLASLTTLFFPLFSTILGIMIFHEKLTWKVITAGVLMFGGFLFLAF